MLLAKGVDGGVEAEKRRGKKEKKKKERKEIKKEKVLKKLKGVELLTWAITTSTIRIYII